MTPRDGWFSAYHVYEGEGHGWRKTETIEQFYETLDRFLRQYVVFA
jgi:dipeptidyl aminopeptidase/acylaminoacyl peptidase